MALTAKKVYAILKRQISDMEAKLNSPVRYRGTVATADLLPLNPDIGDMYNIESKSVYGEAGMNVAWNGVVWDTMGAPIDMSLYLTKEEAETVMQRLVTEYFEKNPVKPGATTEQAQQIEQNKTDIASLKTETDSLKEDLTSKADKTSLAQTDRKLDALWKLNQGISYEFQTDDTEAYQKTVPSGAKMVSIKSIGGKTIVWNQMISDGVGELMSAPVNEVTEQGKNLLGGKAFADKIVELGGTLDEANGKVSIAASVVSDKTVFEFPDESKSYTIILSGENTNTNLQSTNLRTDKGACNRFVDRCSITTVTGAKKIFGAYDTQVAIYDYEKCGIFEGVLTADDFKPYHKTSYPIPQAILDLDGYGESGNFVDFVEKKYHKGDSTIDISDIIGDTFQEPLEVEAGGTLTFKNSHGDDYRIPVPSSEEYVISLAEVAK